MYDINLNQRCLLALDTHCYFPSRAVTASDAAMVVQTIGSKKLALLCFPAAAEFDLKSRLQMAVRVLQLHQRYLFDRLIFWHLPCH